MDFGTETSAFDVAVLSADLAVVRGMVRTFFSRVKVEDWERPTESRPKGWTLKQAFCHVVAAAELFTKAAEDNLKSGAFFPPVRSRQELSSFNQKQIKLREDLPPEYLLHTFLESLSQMESLIADLSDRDLERPVQLNVYNRPLTLGELVGNQLCHPTLVHGAQLANGIRSAPLWRHFSTELMHRQLTRFFHIFSHVYWPERGGNLTAVMNFNINGPDGGHWYVLLDREGGSVGEGSKERPNLTLQFASTDAFCSIFTAQLSPVKGLITGKVFARGNIPLAFKLPTLFKPT